MLHRNLKTIIALLLAFSLAACAGTSLMGPDDTPELGRKKAYMVARKEFAQTLQRYNDHYARADAETKAKWKKDIDPKWAPVEKALDAWEIAITDDIDPAAKEQMYLDLKTEFFRLLLSIGVEVE